MSVGPLWVTTVAQPAWDLLGRLAAIDTRVSAKRVLLAVAVQESGLEYRRQFGGTARGLWQFEQTGIEAIASNSRTAMPYRQALAALGLRGESPGRVHDAIEWNDSVAAICARLLLWADDRPVPCDVDGAWLAYVFGWRPGRPRRETWAKSWETARWLAPE